MSTTLPESDYLSARFAEAVTFRGATLSHLVVEDGRTVATHSPGGLFVYWQAPGTETPQMRLVPWANVVCCEPTPAQLDRLLGSAPAKGTAKR